MHRGGNVPLLAPRREYSTLGTEAGISLLCTEAGISLLCTEAGIPVDAPRRVSPLMHRGGLSTLLSERSNPWGYTLGKGSSLIPPVSLLDGKKKGIFPGTTFERFRPVLRAFRVLGRPVSDILNYSQFMRNPCSQPG